jgi:hypothetical protein
VLQQGTQAKIEPRKIYFVSLLSTLLIIMSGMIVLSPPEYHSSIEVQLGQNDQDFMFYVKVIFYISLAVYIIAALAADALRYLWNLDNLESIVEYADRITAERPYLEFHCECYHWETRIRYVTKTSTRQVMVDGETAEVKDIRHVPETYQEKIITHRGTQPFEFRSFVDVTPPLNDMIRRFRAVRVDCDYDISFGDDQTAGGYEAAKAAFISQNHQRDELFEFSETTDILGFREKFLTITDPSRKPVFMHWAGYLLGSLIGLSWPYQTWLQANTAHGYIRFKKNIFFKTTGP